MHIKKIYRFAGALCNTPKADCVVCDWL